MFAAAIQLNIGRFPILYYTGRAGEEAFSFDRNKAFAFYSKEGALRKAEQLSRMRNVALATTSYAPLAIDCSPVTVPDQTDDTEGGSCD